MDDIESRAIENIHDYLKGCLEKNICNDKEVEENNVDDVSLIYSSLKRYILRLTNINNFIKQENYFLRKKNEELIKKHREKNILKNYKNEKGIHGLYMKEINKLNKENEFIKYKFQKMLRKNLTLERNYMQLNNSLLNREYYSYKENDKNKPINIKLNESNERSISSNFDINDNQFTYTTSEIQLGNSQGKGKNCLDVINPFSFEQKIERILKCAYILEDILNILNNNIRYDEPRIFQQKVKNIKAEKEKLALQNAFLKEKILQIETFILNDPFLVEKFNFFYDITNINFDESIKNNYNLYESSNMKMLYHNLCSLENKNDDLKQELLNEKKKSHIYKRYMYDMRNKFKADLTELCKLNYENSVNYNRVNQFYSTHRYSTKQVDPYHFIIHDDTTTEKKELQDNHRKEMKWKYMNYLYNMNNSEFFGMFKMSNEKIDHNQQMLAQAWRRIGELDGDIDYIKVCSIT
ncbi:rap guanine nucleotide exchange factor, putative (EPAC) [Plasmodium ovale curtisi]|uniref:Rap guanine nucleotide exchange factor, putative (EPAC) n=1 Tax=Plasmodium ovale curtisi TaxID=864141 RepID=A0A1A8WXH3_PLAOA|nr:rap guanine nucleotide exchange factor, putative (EPAC) [Plasmodium ovale curtisi]SBS97663.1 rap guanine nucleotide exchange factor, putative (EPAC) [Plasmodium ovale curtisi]